jgi:5-methylcytosine-specific restriction endonuclease McrA
MKNLRELLRAHVGLPCPYCGNPMEQPIRSHIRSVRFGGSLTDDNKVVVCRSCHDDKGYLTLKDWLRKLRRENDPREPIVKAFRAARKAAEALLAA